ATYPQAASAFAITSQMPTSSGYYAYSSATATTFTPKNGDVIKINGVLFQIPAAGITGCGNTSVFVNGTGASNLGATTLYYVYVFSNSGTLTCDFSTTAHTVSSTVGNIGTEIETGNDTRSLIGMVYTNGSSQFVIAQTLSWFNRRDRSVSVSTTSNRALTTTATTWLEVSNTLEASFISWGDETTDCSISGGAFITTSTNTYYLSAAFDGTTPYDTGTALLNGSSALFPFLVKGTGILAEGNHYCTLLNYAATGTGGGSVAGSVTAGQRTATIVRFRG
ncbi:MAG: hypothetical protein KGL39_50360, partial [Patescibacteria group bacterium]|nr:hypothetical protein [Patescibacteria group bacterium]